MNIVYCLPQIYNPGGIERIVTIKANHLADVLGWDVTIILAAQNGKKCFYEVSDKIKIIDLGLPYFDMLDMPLHKRLLFKYRLNKMHKQKLKDVLFQIKPDVTVSTLTFESPFLPSIKDGSKKVLEFHFCRGHKRLMASSFGFKGLLKLSYLFSCWEEENIIIPKYDKFVVLTEEDKSRWLPKNPNVEYIPNILPFVGEQIANHTRKNVIAVGRLDAQKGFDRLIDIWSLIVNKQSEWTLKIYGEGQDKEMLQKQIDNLGLSKSVQLCGATKDIRSKYLESSIFVMTSRYEGMPMTMLEAKSLGLPVVSYDFPCGPRDLIEDCVDGYIVEEGDKDTLSQKLINLMRNENIRKSFGVKGKENALRYTEDNVMKLWEQLFSEIIK